MAETKHILILANSARAGKHCVAGKFVIPRGDSKFDVCQQWIRLNCPNEPEGAVPYINTICPNHGSVRPLDIVQVVLDAKCNDEDHPEDWNYDPSQRWEFAARFDPKNLSSIADTPDSIWHDGAQNNAVAAGYVRHMQGSPATLYLIKAPDNWVFAYWNEWNTFKGKDTTQRKLTFSYANQTHEFSVTDTAFTSRHKIYDKATSQSQTITARDLPNAFFCLSLTKLTPPDFNRYHYKICATIFEP
ncbi:MAG: hypothetical protein ABSH11_05090 [Verrucomicrobiota bacterium]|jgi:hypothetical protein